MWYKWVKTKKILITIILLQSSFILKFYTESVGQNLFSSTPVALLS